MTRLMLSHRVLAIVLTTLLVAASVAQTSSQTSSQSDIETASAIVSSAISQATSSTVSATASLASSQPSPQTPIDLDGKGSSLHSDGTCALDYLDLIAKAFHDSIEMARVTVEDLKTGHEDDPAFWDLFGPRAVGNLTSIRDAFSVAHESSWTITASCTFDESDPVCTDRFRYGGIGEGQASNQGVRREEAHGLSATLIFCPKFFGFPSLDYRVKMGVNHRENPTARYDLGFFHDNQGR
jgi:hypothetical protein